MLGECENDIKWNMHFDGGNDALWKSECENGIKWNMSLGQENDILWNISFEI
jgi:hypothetical protein